MNRSRHLTAKLQLVLMLASAVCVPDLARAGRLLDYIRSYDLNNYALGMAVSVSQSPYKTASNSVIAYPFLTSFRHPAFHDDWLLLSDGELGARVVTKNGWVFGGVGRIETLGLGSDRTEELIGLDDRQWTVEVAPLVEYRGWPVQLSGKLFKEISGRHGGVTSEFKLTLPFESSWGYAVPGVKLAHHDEDYVRYYYGVTPAEARPDRPEYTPGSETNFHAFVRVGYQVSDKWLLIGTASWEKLGDEITGSPIVGRDELWSGSLSLAYNANVFQPREFRSDAYRMPTLEFRVGLFQDNVQTAIVPRDGDGTPLPPIEIEDLLSISGREAVLQLDGIWRIGNYHRLEATYFNLSRSSEFSLTVNPLPSVLKVPDGADVDVKSDLRMLRLAYSYSLMSDAQKELGLMAGLHVSRLHTEINSVDTGQTVLTSASTPLPAVGIHGTVALGRKTYLRAYLQLFRMDFDNYSGSMNHLNMVVQHVFRKNLSVGVGYSLYDLSLDSSHNSIDGRVEVRHHGPQVFLGMHF